MGAATWRSVKLADMGQIVSGGTPDSQNSEYWDGDILWATPTDITPLTSRYISSTARRITRLGLKSSAAALVPERALLVCTRATIGELAIASRPMATNQGFKNLILGPDCDSDYVYYLLLRNRQRLLKQSCGSTFLELSGRDFGNLTFAVPDLAEQLRVAGILRTWDDALDRARALRRAWRLKKTALMQRLLAPNGAAGRQRWREVRLGQVARVTISNVDKKTVPGEHPVRLCNYMDVYRHDVIRPTMNLMRATATRAEIEKCRLEVDDVIITKDSEDPTDIAVPAIVGESSPDMVCGYHLAILRPEPEVHGMFLKYLLEAPRNRAYFGARANGATRFGLTQGSIKRAVLDLPDLAAQRRIARILQTCDEGIRDLTRYLAALAKQRRGLLASLVSNGESPPP